MLTIVTSDLLWFCCVFVLVLLLRYYQDNNNMLVSQAITRTAMKTQQQKVSLFVTRILFVGAI